MRSEDGRLVIDLVEASVRVDGALVRLTPTEWRIVEHCAKNTGRLIGSTELLQAVWGPGYSRETNYLRVYLSQLRQKLEADAAHPRHFLTEPGLGYRFVL